MTAIWASDPHGDWRLLAPSSYPAESALHDLVEKTPQILPLSGSPRITVLGREVRLGNGYADLLAVDSAGQLVVIEVKLAGNSESRRAVVAQMLSYAAYLQGLDPRQLDSQVLSFSGAGSVLEAVQADDQERAIDPATFTDGLAQSLAEGKFRLVVVLDSAPDELVQLVGYLESLTDKIVVDLITVTAYDVNGSRVLVPQRVEPARRVRELSDAQAATRQATALQGGSAEFRVVIDQAPSEQREFLRRLTEWAEKLDQDGVINLATYRGKAGITTLLPRLPAENVGLVTVYKDVGASYLQFWRSVFERRAPNSIPRVEAALGGTVGQGNTSYEASDELLDALTDAYREAAGRDGGYNIAGEATESL